MSKADRVVYISRGWQPVYIGFCPSEKAWEREMRRLNCEGASYPTTDGSVTTFENDETGKTTCLVVINRSEGRDPREIVGLIVHEAVHVWQRICKVMGEDDPGWEMEAYSIQAIAQDLIKAFDETRPAPVSAPAEPAA